MEYTDVLAGNFITTRNTTYKGLKGAGLRHADLFGPGEAEEFQPAGPKVNRESLKSQSRVRAALDEKITEVAAEVGMVLGARSATTDGNMVPSATHKSLLVFAANTLATSDCTPLISTQAS